MVTKLTADQQRRVGDIQQFQKVVEHVAKLVAELNSNRAAKATFIDNICESIARQLSQMRQRALTSGVGTIADVAGAMSVMAGGGGGGGQKKRGLSGGGEKFGGEARPGAQPGEKPRAEATPRA